MRKIGITILVMSFFVMSLVGCTRDEIKENVNKGVDVVLDGAEKVAESDTFKDVTSYVKEKGIELSTTACSNLQDYIKEHYNGLKSINNIKVTSSKHYMVSFTDGDGKDHSVEFTFDAANNAVAVENEE